MFGVTTWIFNYLTSLFSVDMTVFFAVWGIVIFTLYQILFSLKSYPALAPLHHRFTQISDLVANSFNLKTQRKAQEAMLPVIAIQIPIFLILVVIAVVSFLLMFRHGHDTITTLITWLIGLLLMVVMVFAVFLGAIALILVNLYGATAAAFLTAEWVRKVTRGNQGLTQGLFLGFVSCLMTYFFSSPYPLLIWAIVHCGLVPLLTIILKKRTRSRRIGLVERIRPQFVLRSLGIVATYTVVALLTFVNLLVGSTSIYNIHNLLWHHRDKVVWQTVNSPLEITANFTIESWRLGLQTHEGILLRPHVEKFDNTVVNDSLLMMMALKSSDASTWPRQNITNLSVHLGIYHDDKLVGDYSSAAPFINGYAVFLIADDDGFVDLDPGEYYIRFSVWGDVIADGEGIGPCLIPMLEGDLVVSGDNQTQIYESLELSKIDKLVPMLYPDTRKEYEIAKDEGKQIAITPRM